MQENSKATDTFNAAVQMRKAQTERLRGGGKFIMTCHNAQGELKWAAESDNLVVNVGLKDMNDKYFSGSAYTAAWFVGLYGAGASNTPAAADTAASHAGWTEVVPYSNATRPAATFAAATTADPSVIDNAASPAKFNINATATIGGAFLISDSTKSGTTGILFSAADFAAPGDRSVASGDVVNVTYQFSLDAL